MALRFNTGAGYDLASIAFVGSAAHTVCARALVTDGTPPGDFIYLDDGGGGSFGQSIWLGPNTSTNVQFNEADNGGVITASYGATATLGTWHHYALVYTGTDMLSYVDGVLMNTQSVDLSARPDMDHADIGYGADFTVQDVAIWSRALSGPEVAELAAYRQTSAMDTGLYAWLPMFSGSEFTDQSGGGHDLATGATPASDAPGIPLTPGLTSTASTTRSGASATASVAVALASTASTTRTGAASTARVAQALASTVSASRSGASASARVAQALSSTASATRSAGAATAALVTPVALTSTASTTRSASSASARVAQPLSSSESATRTAANGTASGGNAPVLPERFGGVPARFRAGRRQLRGRH